MNDNPFADTKSNTIYTENPYEWVGIYHNEILDYVHVNYSVPNYSGIWPDQNFIEIISSQLQESIDTLYPQLLDSIDTGSSVLFNFMNNPSLVLSTYRSAIINSATLTQKDKYYSLAVLTLSEELLDSLYDYPIAMNKIINLENEILNQDWDSNEKGLAFLSISVYKHSYQYWNNIYEPISKVNKISVIIAKPVDRVRIAANGVADFVIGSATFLSVTSATGGVAAIPALKESLIATAKASTAVDYIGGLLGWW
jgi:hypothetical protein